MRSRFSRKILSDLCTSGTLYSLNCLCTDQFYRTSQSMKLKDGFLMNIRSLHLSPPDDCLSHVKVYYKAETLDFNKFITVYTWKWFHSVYSSSTSTWVPYNSDAYGSALQSPFLPQSLSSYYVYFEYQVKDSKKKCRKAAKQWQQIQFDNFGMLLHFDQDTNSVRLYKSHHRRLIPFNQIDLTPYISEIIGILLTAIIRENVMPSAYFVRHFLGSQSSLIFIHFSFTNFG